MTAYLGRPTGSNVHWVWTGSSWNLMAYGGGSSGGSSAVTSSVTTTLLYPFTATTGSFIVPAGITSLQVKMWGPGGGNGCYASYTAGAGGFTSGTISVTPGEELLLIVGGGGAGVTGTTGNGGNGGWGNGGFGTKGDASSGGGGGYTGIFTASVDQANAIMIAGGGGGASGFAFAGGGGGGSTGGNGNNGTGGTQTAAGGGGTSGGRLFGGKGLGSQTVSSADDDGGGGSGYWGGGGGSGDGRSGGGGSGYIHPTRVTLSGTIAGSNGNGSNTRALPPMTSDIDYLTIVSSSAAAYSLYGVGTGGNSTVSSIGFDGGHGFIVLRYTSGQNIALWFEGTPNTAYITSSVAIGVTGSAAAAGGQEAFFYVSGTIGLTGSAAKKSIFGGDLITSGALGAIGNSYVAGTPAEFPGLVGWYEAVTSSVTLDTASSSITVKEWRDLSGRGNHFGMSTKSFQPFWNSSSADWGGIPTVEFQPTKILSSSTSITLTSFTFVFVLQTKGNNSILYEQTYDTNTHVSASTLYTGINNTVWVKRGGVESSKNSPGGANWASENFYPTMYAHQFGGNHVQHRLINRNFDYQLNDVVSNNPGISGSQNYIYVGGRANAQPVVSASLGYSGSIAAMALYTPAIRMDQLFKVLRYFGQKFNVGGP